MNVRVILASLAGAVVSFLLGWLVYGMLLSGYYEANTNHFNGLMINPPNLIGIFLSGWVMSFLFAFIFSKWANISSFVPGLIAAGIISFLIMLSFDLSFWSMMNLFGKKLLVVDVVVGTAFYAFIGGVVALVLGFKKEG
jgi:hypothetical protein